MIKIIKVHDHLGAGVYDMQCDCPGSDAFIVNSRASCPVHYNPTDHMVDCPFCHIKVALFIIVGNYEDEIKASPVIGEDTQEERK